MNYNNVIKALENCINMKCLTCEYNAGASICIKNLMVDILDFIKRQNEEVEEIKGAYRKFVKKQNSTEKNMQATRESGERERLINLLADSEVAYAQYLCDESDKAIKGDITRRLMTRFEFFADRLTANSVIVPSVKIGDYVYILYETDDEPCGWAVDDAQMVTEVGQNYFWTSQFIPPRDDLRINIPYSEIGKTVFLTKEEAEQALRKESKGK